MYSRFLAISLAATLLLVSTSQAASRARMNRKKAASAASSQTAASSASATTKSTASAQAATPQPTPVLEQSFEPLPGHGLYAIWYKDEKKTLDLPFIKGGQMVFQWGEIDKGNGKYDWSEMDAQLKHFHEIGRKATIQVNGNAKPAWLFEKVALLPKTALPAKEDQVRDKQGALMYWDPIFMNAYKDFIKAYGAHLKQSPYKDAVLGVRLNFNAIGTEHGGAGAEFADLSKWQPAPDGHKYDKPITNELWTDYKHMVVATFAESFTPEFIVFLRNNIMKDNILTAEQMQMLKDGKLGLFHTSSEIEPHVAGIEPQYQAFIRFCKAGKTPGYAESWADAWGRHGSKTDPRFFTPAQYNYWRLLIDLNCGVSFIAIYGTDLEHAAEPEFRAGFDFAAKYAGFHASPDVAPGAWVALREGNFLKGDYTLLMERDAAKSTDHAVDKQGPDDQHYGQWARAIEANGKMYFRVNPLFAKSINGKAATLRIVYLDKGTDSFTVAYDVNGTKKEETVQKKDTGRWQEAMIPLQASGFTAALDGNDILLSGTGKNVFHMVEVQRGGATAGQGEAK